jgi:hypothetical protein
MASWRGRLEKFTEGSWRSEVFGPIIGLFAGGLLGALFGGLLGLLFDGLLSAALAAVGGAGIGAIFGSLAGLYIGAAVSYLQDMVGETFFRRNYWPLIGGALGAFLLLLSLYLADELGVGELLLALAIGFGLGSCFAALAQSVFRGLCSRRRRERDSTDEP